MRKIRVIERIRQIDWRSLRVRVLATTGAALGLVLGGWCWQGWSADTRSLERDLSSRLQAVAATTGVAVDGDAHARLEQELPERPAATLPPAYVELRDTLAQIARRNELDGEISTLVLHESSRAAVESAPHQAAPGALELIVTSGDRPQWRRDFAYVPAMAPALFESRVSGGREKTPEGQRVAAYAPLVDSFGTVTGVVRASVPWSGSLLTAWLWLAGRLALAGVVLGATLWCANQVVLRALMPLSKLERAAGTLACGNWNEAVEVETRASELVVLSSALEGLRMGVSSRLDEERQTNRRLLESKRVAEVSLASQADVLAQLSSEIRRPLAAFTEKLRALESAPLEAEARRTVDAALQEGYALSSRIEHTLQLARLEGGDGRCSRESFDLAELIERVAGPVRVRTQANDVGFRVVVPETLPTRLVGDPGALGEVLGQLLQNSLAATKDGSITLRVWRTAAREGELLLRFEVADTGTGVSSQTRERVERALRERMDFAHSERTGLGLARASELVALHGGELAFESRPGSGSRFWFFARFEEPTHVGAGQPAATLPSVEAALPAASAAAPAPQSSSWIHGAS